MTAEQWTVDALACTCQPDTCVGEDEDAPGFCLACHRLDPELPCLAEVDPGGDTLQNLPDGAIVERLSECCGEQMVAAGPDLLCPVLGDDCEIDVGGNVAHQAP